MASKHKAEASGKANRIRLVVLDADLSDANLSELTQAITYALRPVVAAIPPGRVAQTALPTAGTANGNGSGTHAEDVADDEEVATEISEEPRAQPAPRGAKKTRTPKYVSDLFTKEAQTEFQKYAAVHPTDQHATRYLVATMWLKDHGHETVNADKLYTCYKVASWPMDFVDWDVAFRNHAARSRRMERVGKGEYRITPLGEGDVDKLKAATD
jgi:hypothetical protein